VNGTPRVFDEAAVRAHRRRAASEDRSRRFLKDEMRSRLIERLFDVKRRFDHVLDLGTLDPAEDRAALAHALNESRIVSDPRASIVSSDLVAVSPHPPMVVGSAECLPFAAGAFDLVISAGGLQWVNDLPGALAQLRFCLQPDGLLLAAIFGGRTLSELRAALTAAELDITGGASPRVAPFVDLQAAAGLLQRAGLALPVADVETIHVTYPTLFALMAELRALGDTSGLADRPRHFTRRAILLRAAEIYAERFPAPGGRISATFEMMMLTGWAPAASQPKPLKPGSGRHSLAAALKP
jgi:SAM-dependent methyltransferase